MRKSVLILLLISMIGVFLTACATRIAAPVQAVENYLDALVSKDAERLPTLVCGAWEEEALVELDSFQAVTARLENVSCELTGSEGGTALVKCTGNIVTTYNNEDQSLDLSVRTYEVVQEGGDWLVCGTR